jgi:histidinol-phosphate aminotransferase
MHRPSGRNNAGWQAGRTGSIPIYRQQTETDGKHLNYERQNIREMKGYVSGEQPERPDIIKLNTNENPYPPGPAVEAALRSIQIESLRRYPPPTALPLRKALATLHGIDPGNLIVTNGGDELLRLLLATFVAPDEKIATAAPSYSLYEVLANAHGCRMVNYPLGNDWSLPQGFARQMNADGIKLCFVVNPHAPSGTLIDAAALRSLAAEFRGVLVIDEAYVDFVDPSLAHDTLPLVTEFDNVMILRTFSKGYSLAGLRMAYGIGSRNLVDPMQYKTKDSYNTDLIAQTLALAAIEDQDYAASTWMKVRNERTRVASALAGLGFDMPASQSNFLLARVPAGQDAGLLYQGLKEMGILVRYFNVPELQDRLRISIGTAGENDRLLSALTTLMSPAK